MRHAQARGIPRDLLAKLQTFQDTTSATGNGSLIFEIDGVPQLQLSGTMPWQQS